LKYQKTLQNTSNRSKFLNLNCYIVKLSLQFQDSDQQFLIQYYSQHLSNIRVLGLIQRLEAVVRTGKQGITIKQKKPSSIDEGFFKRLF
jgi:hypothetical protein